MTDQELKDLVASLAINQAIISEENKIGFAELREDQKQIGKLIKELREAQKQTDEQLKKTDEQLKKTDEQLKKTIIKLDGMGVTQGEISEDIFGDNLEDLFEKQGKIIYKTEKNLIIKGKCEYDLIGINGTEVFVGEVKTRLTNKHIDTFIAKRLKPFKKYVPKYSTYKLYGFVAGRTLAKGALEYATKKGLYVLKQDSKGMAKFVNSIPLEIL